MSESIAIRECLDGDAETLALVGQASFLEAFAGILPGRDILAHCTNQHSVGVYRDWLKSEAAKIWIAETELGQAGVGYLVLTPPKLPIADPRDDDLEIKRIYILHRFHGIGVGRRLMDAAIDYSKSKGTRRILLGVYSRNADAIAFYERLKFRQVGVRKFNVGHNVYDDAVLALDLMK
jgi:ribosomal protein S18 acetylase RimI-like enzyme